MDPIYQKLIQELQGNIPITENPYETMGNIIGISENEVIERLKQLKKEGRLKRISAILRHQKSGYSVNAMVVFKVAESDIEHIGTALARSPLVSHCYQRKTYHEWPYNVYAMLHSREAKEIEQFIHGFVEKHEIIEYEILFSEKELKKESMVYFE